MNIEYLLYLRTDKYPLDKTTAILSEVADGRIYHNGDLHDGLSLIAVKHVKATEVAVLMERLNKAFPENKPLTRWCFGPGLNQVVNDSIPAHFLDQTVEIRLGT